MQLKKVLSSTAFLGLFLLALAGCQEKEGPAEKAGKQIDEAASELSEGVKKATD